MDLTLRQQKFADNFIKTGNKYQSAVDAGYSKSYALAHADKLSDNVGIRKYINDRLAELKSDEIADQQEILKFLTRVLRRKEIEENVVTLRKPTAVKMKSANGEDYTKMSYEEVSEIVETKTKNADAIKAADILTRVIESGSVASIKVRKLKAEAEIAEKKAESGDLNDVTINITKPGDSDDQD